MKRLSKAGKGHRKTLRMIPVFLRISTNHTVWAEIDTYKVGTVRNSCSKMHTIHKKEFEKDMFSHEGQDSIENSASINSIEGFDVVDVELAEELKKNEADTLRILNKL